MNDTPIIQSMLDDDLYKFTMGAVVFHNFPDVDVTYQFINRGKTQFPVGFAGRLVEQLFHLATIRMNDGETFWLKSQPFMRPTYAEWLSNYRYDLGELAIEQNGPDLSITFQGKWYRLILWEVKLMAIISELYFRMTGHELAPDWRERIVQKAKDLEYNYCLWSDFGTRRRRSFAVQNEVVSVMKTHRGFLGTSNPYLAYTHNVAPIGTSAHEAVMAMECLYGADKANKTWLDLWRAYYGDKLSIALTDTFTTEVFLKGMGYQDLLDWQGMRQDSADPYNWARMVLETYHAHRVNAMDKSAVFSDNLNVPKFIDLTKTFRPFFGKVIGGIGTNFSNDTFTEAQVAAGLKPLNMVIKLSSVKVGDKWVGAVKLSDSEGKYTGKKEDIGRVKGTLNIV
jgi:nicotinate phosphoribosyltransferase